jgi:hypothetical protein
LNIANWASVKLGNVVTTSVVVVVVEAVVEVVMDVVVVAEVVAVDMEVVAVVEAEEAVVLVGSHATSVSASNMVRINNPFFIVSPSFALIIRS